MTADQRNRQSYGLDTLEDDPFVEAHRDAMKKKKPDPSVNYGYASQGIQSLTIIITNYQFITFN